MGNLLDILVFDTFICDNFAEEFVSPLNGCPPQKKNKKKKKKKTPPPPPPKKKKKKKKSRNKAKKHIHKHVYQKQLLKKSNRYIR